MVRRARTDAFAQADRMMPVIAFRPFCCKLGIPIASRPDLGHRIMLMSAERTWGSCSTHLGRNFEVFQLSDRASRISLRRPYGNLQVQLAVGEDECTLRNLGLCGEGGLRVER